MLQYSLSLGVIDDLIVLSDMTKSIFRGVGGLQLSWYQDTSFQSQYYAFLRQISSLKLQYSLQISKLGLPHSITLHRIPGQSLHQQSPFDIVNQVLSK